MHLEAERRAHKLANHMWLQQAELNRTQERALQDALNAIVKQNRQLLDDNECLKSRNEKLSSKYDSYCHRGHLGCTFIIYNRYINCEKRMSRWPTTASI